MLLDAAVERVESRTMADFDSAVAAVRVGTIIAHDRKAAGRWDRQVAARNRQSAGLSGAALEHAIAALAATNPEYIVSG
jgi:hypothetical protein